MSIGRTGPPAPVVQEAIVYAVRQHGAFVVVAAGNEFEEGNPTERLAEFAAADQGRWSSVGAIGRDKTRAFYSTTGSYVELAAPGGNSRPGGRDGEILQQTYDFASSKRTRRPGADTGPPRFDVFVYEFLQGTSMAAPHVSGFAALLMQQGITDPAAIEAAMEQLRDRPRAVGTRQRSSATASSTRAPRCAAWDWRSDARCHRRARAPAARAASTSQRSQISLRAASATSASPCSPRQKASRRSSASESGPVFGGGVEVGDTAVSFSRSRASRFRRPVSASSCSKTRYSRSTSPTRSRSRRSS